MTVFAGRSWTVEEFGELTDRPENDGRRLELSRGEVVEWPWPYRPHGVVVGTVGSFLTEYSHAVRSGYATARTGIVLSRDPATVRTPDACFFAETISFADLPDEWDETPPAVAVEVLSPNDDPEAMRRKMDDYRLAGWPAVWVIDYEARTVAVHRPGRPVDVIPASGAITDDRFPGLSIRVGNLFLLPGEWQRA